MPLSEKEFAQFKTITRNLTIALKNALFYQKDHPLRNVSVINLKCSLDDWFARRDGFQLGISQDNLYFEGAIYGSQEDYFKEVAAYFHSRGVIFLTLLKGITTNELADFLDLVRLDGKALRDKGGVTAQIPADSHIKVKEIDYRLLLSDDDGEGTSEEEDLWKRLFKDLVNSPVESLPESRAELLSRFFKDHKRSTQVLNRLYHQAMVKHADQQIIQSIQQAVILVCRYYKYKDLKSEAQDLKANLMAVISHLHPDLISRLLQQTEVGDETLDLAEEITRDFSDTYIANFIESLITESGSMNENLLLLFDKLTPDPDHMRDIMPILADNLFSKNLITPHTLTQLQLAIRELFRKQPNSSFINEMYRITVESVINKKIKTLVYITRLTPLVTKFLQSVKQDRLMVDKIRLILNILWVEKDPGEFKKWAETLVGDAPDLLQTRAIKPVYEILDFFTQKIPHAHKMNQQIYFEREKVLTQLTSRENLIHLIAFIPDSTKNELKTLLDILLLIPEQAAPLLIESYMSSKNPLLRNKLHIIFFRMPRHVCNHVLQRLRRCEPYMIRDLFAILKATDPEQLSVAASQMIHHHNKLVLWEALDNYAPTSAEKRQEILKLFNNQKDLEIRKKAASVLLKSNDPETIDKLFICSQKGTMRKIFLNHLIGLCGSLKAENSLPQLEKIYSNKSLLSTRHEKQIQIQTARSLIMLDPEKGREVVEKTLHRKNKSIQEAIRKILAETVTTGEYHGPHRNN
jgi:hypothetical protein